MYARLALKCISETLFDDAADHFLKSTLDPRILICLFPRYGDQLLRLPTPFSYSKVSQISWIRFNLLEISVCITLAFGWLAQSHVQRHPG